MENTKPNVFTKMVNYFKEVKVELKKVVWPTFSKVKKNTLIVILYVLVIGVVIWALDAIFGLGLSFFINR